MNPRTSVACCRSISGRCIRFIQQIHQALHTTHHGHHVLARNHQETWGQPKQWKHLSSLHLTKSRRKKILNTCLFLILLELVVFFQKGAGPAGFWEILSSFLQKGRRKICKIANPCQEGNPKKEQKKHAGGVWKTHVRKMHTITWVVPPPSKSGKWRFIEIPYKKRSHPSGDCYWEGDNPHHNCCLLTGPFRNIPPMMSWTSIWHCICDVQSCSFSSFRRVVNGKGAIISFSSNLGVSNLPKMQVCTKTPIANPVAKIWKRALGLGIRERELNCVVFAKFGISTLQIVKTFFWAEGFSKKRSRAWGFVEIWGPTLPKFDEWIPKMTFLVQGIFGLNYVTERYGTWRRKDGHFCSSAWNWSKKAKKIHAPDPNTNRNLLDVLTYENDDGTLHYPQN